MAATTLTPRQRAALPGGVRDRVVAALKWLLPTLALALLMAMVIWPLAEAQEFSFLLAKDRVDQARERLRVDTAQYRGETSRGEPFVITAAGAVQRSSAVPIVELDRLSARLAMEDGPAVVTAPSGRYYMDEDRLLVAGPVALASAGGYSLDSGAVAIDLARRTVETQSPVTGTLPIGSFRAGRLSADIKGRRVVLEGRAHLRIKGARGTGGR